MTENPVAIITDSTCDIPEELIKKYAIRVVPQIVIWGEQEFRDRVTLQPEDFYTRLQTDPVRPTSAQATVMDFKNVYQKAVQQGAQEILVLTVSAAMSGTYQSAVQAGEGLGVPVHVVDSKGPTMSLGWQVLAAARVRENGGGIPEMLTKTAEVRETLVQFVGMDSLEYLQRGGRIGGAAKWVGSMLQIRPVVEINHTSGLVEPAGLARTHTKMVELLYHKFFEKMNPARPMRVAVLHGNNPLEAKTLADRIHTEFQPIELLVQITGPVLGINTGPNALALCGYCE